MTSRISFIPYEIAKVLDSNERVLMEANHKLIKVIFKITTSKKHEKQKVTYPSDLKYVDENDITFYINQNSNIEYSRYWQEPPIIEIGGVLKQTDIRFFVELGRDIYEAEYPYLILDGYVWVYIHDV